MLPSGIYVVGDLYEILKDDLLLDLLTNRYCGGEFTLFNGTKIAIYSTDGKKVLQDKIGRLYSTESGTIGCVLARDCDVDQPYRGSFIEDFKYHFFTSSYEGIIRFDDMIFSGADLNHWAKTTPLIDALDQDFTVPSRSSMNNYLDRIIC